MFSFIPQYVRPLLFAAAFLALPFLASGASARLIDSVDPIIGTGGEGFSVGSVSPGPTIPFGMVKPGPDTSTDASAPSFYHCAGYWHKDTHIRGFSHTRMHGTGVPDYGNIMIMPAIGRPADMVNEESYRTKFSHKQEVAKTGYYSVDLLRTGIKAEITAADYTAHHRQTFPASAESVIVVHPSHVNYISGDKNEIETDVHVDPAKNEVTGWFNYKGPMSGRDGGVKTYFILVTKTPFKTFGTWADGKYRDSERLAHGVKAGAVLGFSTTEGQVIETKVAISYISVEQARANLRSEAAGWDFDGMRRRAENAWEKMLSRIQVEGGTDIQRRIFYTSLYHSLQMPTNYTEAGGMFLGFDRKPHKAKGFRYYTDFSMWDTFRTLHPLLTLVYPEIQRDMIVSLLKIMEYGGYIPKWPLGASYTNCMSGTPADTVIAESYLKGITNFDVKLAYKGMREVAMKPVPPGSRFGGRGGVDEYIKLGYLPADKHGGAASETLEYAYADYAIARLAEALGLKDDAKMFMERSKNYKNIWNSKVGFFDGRNSDGSFSEPFQATEWRNVYVEGDAWQWLWSVPQDVPGLIELMGGRDTFYNRLNEFFTLSHKSPDSLMPDKYYWHGNEPDLHAAYLFLWTGRPDRTQEEIRWILKKKYAAKGAGIDGNDDGGTLAAWYVFSSMGFFPLPPDTRYYLGSPIFTKMSVQAGKKRFTILAPEASEEKLYIGGAKLNGRAIDSPYIDHRDIVAGGTLELTMTDKPSTWGTSMK